MRLSDSRFYALKQTAMLGNNLINMPHLSNNNVEDSVPMDNDNEAVSSKPLQQAANGGESAKVIPL